MFKILKTFLVGLFWVALILVALGLISFAASSAVYFLGDWLGIQEKERPIFGIVLLSSGAGIFLCYFIGHEILNPRRVHFEEDENEKPNRDNET